MCEKPRDIDTDIQTHVCSQCTFEYNANKPACPICHALSSYVVPDPENVKEKAKIEECRAKVLETAKTVSNRLTAMDLENPEQYHKKLAANQYDLKVSWETLAKFDPEAKPWLKNHSDVCELLKNPQAPPLESLALSSNHEEQEEKIDSEEEAQGSGSDAQDETVVLPLEVDAILANAKK